MSRTLTGAEQKRLRAMYVFEQILWGEGCRYVTGIDEAGRGALAGPVVAAAVVFSHPVMIRGLNDSKQLRPAERNRLYSVISVAANGIGIGKSGPDVIDRDNIRQATLQAMAAAVAQLPQTPDHLLIDGLDRIDWPGPQTAVVDGDAKSLSIAAASVIAKVTRDRIMEASDTLYPEYGFARHKGYGTPEHLNALNRYGPCPLHRRSFRPAS